MTTTNRNNWENKNRLGKVNVRKSKDVADNSHWKSAMPQELKGLVDENVFCEMCADFETDLQFFEQSALSEKSKFDDGSLVLLVDQLLSDDSKVVARAAKKLNDFATGSEAISAALRIKLLSTPRCLGNIFHVRINCHAEFLSPRHHSNENPIN
jgi:hypothetical protein